MQHACTLPEVRRDRELELGKPPADAGGSGGKGASLSTSAALPPLSTSLDRMPTWGDPRSTLLGPGHPSRGGVAAPGDELGGMRRAVRALGGGARPAHAATLGSGWAARSSTTFVLDPSPSLLLLCPWSLDPAQAGWIDALSGTVRRFGRRSGRRRNAPIEVG